MDHKDYDVSRWLTEAVSGIRFKPDRAAVTEELRGHMEDKMEALMGYFPSMTREEAEQRTLKSMGDPAEVGRELAKVHRPWVAWLWLVCRYLRRTVLVLLALSLWVSFGRSPWFTFGGEGEKELDKAPRMVQLVPDAKVVYVDGERVTMERAAFDRYYDRLGVVLRVWTPAWEGRQNNVRRRTAAVDDRGTVYPSSEDFWKGGLTYDTLEYVRGDTGSSTPIWQNYILWVEGVDPEAKWVRLEYDWMGRSFHFTVELQEVEP